LAGQYVFAPGVTIQPNTTYWVYENVTLGVITGGNIVSGTVHDYFTGAANFNYQNNDASTNFRLSGDVVTSTVPAPPAVVLVGLGAGCVALRRYVGHRASA
jgi:hypothetical protein